MHLYIYSKLVLSLVDTRLPTTKSVVVVATKLLFLAVVIPTFLIRNCALLMATTL